jgi:hypothetical protein
MCRSSFSAEYLCNVLVDIKRLGPQHTWLRPGDSNKGSGQWIFSCKHNSDVLWKLRSVHRVIECKLKNYISEFIARNLTCFFTQHHSIKWFQNQEIIAVEKEIWKLDKRNGFWPIHSLLVWIERIWKFFEFGLSLTKVWRDFAHLAL